MRNRLLAVSAAVILAGCATSPLPSGPSVAVMPAVGKPFEVFQAEDNECRGYAQQAVGMSANDAAASSQGRNMAIGTAIGAVAGALLFDSSRGAGPGAAMGLMMGTASGSDQGNRTANDAQRRYDIAYLQCMYAKGNQLPQTSRYQSPAPVQYQPPPPNAPPPNQPPPPPPPQ